MSQQPFNSDSGFSSTGNITSSGNIIGTTTDNPGSLQWIGNSSGDGNSYTTLELRPDDTLLVGGQYLILDPTGGGHIHVRAGGAQDNATGNLFIGGENSYFNLPPGANPPVSIAANSQVWTFGTNGVLNLPGEGILQSTDDTVTLQSFNTVSGNANSVYVGTSGGLGFNDQQIGGNWLEIFRTGTEPEIKTTVGNLSIQTSSNATPYTWTFGSTGNLTLPGNTFAVNYANGTPVTIGGGSSYGDSNVVTLLSNFGSNTISTTGNITSNAIVGGTLRATGSVGNEGGQLDLATAAANTTLVGSSVTVDIFQNRFRIFESGGTFRGGYIDLANCAAAVGTPIVNRTSRIAAANTKVTFNNITAQVGGSPTRLYIGAATSNLQVAGTSQTMTSGSMAVGSWINVPISTGTGNEFAMSGALSSNGDTAVLNITDQTAGTGTWRITGIIANTASNLYSITIEQIA
jgi:hypothetical protein